MKLWDNNIFIFTITFKMDINYEINAKTSNLIWTCKTELVNCYEHLLQPNVLVLLLSSSLSLDF